MPTSPAYPGTMHSDDRAGGEGIRPDDLLPELEVIEQQPLADRADAYAGVLDDLARRLESGPTA